MPVGLTPIPAPSGALTLSDIRQMVVEESGHYELVVDGVGDDWTDNGCNRLIGHALRWLDRHSVHKKSDSWIYKELTSGEAFVQLNIARYIQRVFMVVQSSGARTELKKRDPIQLRNEYGDVPLSTLESGTPAYWTVPVTQLGPEQKDETEATLETDGFLDTDFLFYTTPILYDGILVLPPPDETVSIHILGTWKSVALSADSDYNFWTVNEPDILVDATRREIAKRLHRNNEEVRAIELDLRDNLMKLHHEMVAEEAMGRTADQMRMLALR